jgi:hypothetical protein
VVELVYGVYVDPPTFRFHSGVSGERVWGAWQKMHSSCSLVAFTVPGPDTERLCFVFDT